MHARYRLRRRFDSLDGLRAVAVTGTVWHHTAGGAGILAAGWLGVHMFFAISGFLITTLLLREWSSHGRLDLGAFYVRRALRIFPAYYLTVIVYALMALTVFRHSRTSDDYLAALPAFMTYTANWFYTDAPGMTLFVHGWSLSTEEQFYMLWPPLLALALTRHRGLQMAACAAVVLVVAKYGATHLLEPSLVTTVLTSLSLSICGGVLLALALHSRRGFLTVAPVLARRMSAPVVGALAVLGIVADVPYELIVLAMLALVAACTMREDHLMRPVLSFGPVSYLGKISYGVYLYHLIVAVVVAGVVPGALSPVMFAAATLMGSCLVASVSYSFIEAPFLRIRDRYQVAGLDSTRPDGKMPVYRRFEGSQQTVYPPAS